MATIVVPQRMPDSIVAFMLCGFLYEPNDTICDTDYTHTRTLITFYMLIGCLSAYVFQPCNVIGWLFFFCILIGISISACTCLLPMLVCSFDYVAWISWLHSGFLLQIDWLFYKSHDVVNTIDRTH